MAFKATPKQVKFIEAALTLRYRFMGIGGGIRGTKTICVLTLLVILCRIYPRSRWAIVRTDLPTLRRNILPSMEKVRMWSGGFVGELNMSDWSYTCANGSRILLFAEQFTQDPELERWKGLEVNGFVLEESSELNEKSANKAIERAGSWIIPGTAEDPTPRQPPPFVFCTFNPCSNWPRRWFYEPYAGGSIKAPYYFEPATIADNPFASEEYKESLKYLPTEEYNRFVKGEWDFIDEPNQLIKSEWIWAARNVDPIPGTIRMGVDVARYGDDWSSLMKTRGNQLVRYVGLQKFDTMVLGSTILNEAADRLLPVAGPNVRIDGVGMGGPVVDYCRLKGLPVYDVVAGAAPIERPGMFFRFKNLRSQMWWETREKLRLAQLSLFMGLDRHKQPIALPEKLVGDLASVRYEITGDKVISVEPKDDIKLRLGRSPDDGDAFVNAVFDFPDLPSRPILPGTILTRG